ncbi:NAD(P)H-dependent oxidoreductase [Candidatus Gracilibacteria bacterium]|nr:NAD(P)H-dependent oxidoreductase [Candidatus Gracilibacteria bacterium]
MPEAEFEYLHKYINKDFDVEEQQKKLSEADIIVLQFPFFWYSMPSIMQKWFEDVFVYGFAYGSAGHKLKGKKLVVSLTTGGSDETYTLGAEQGYPIEVFLFSIQRIAAKCGLEWSGFFHTGGINPFVEGEKRQELDENIRKHSEKLLEKIKSL